MAKKISAENFNYIWEPSEIHREKDWMKTYTMEKLENGSYSIYEAMKPWLFVLLFVPVSILTLFSCLWDGGLKTFEFPCNSKYNWKLDIYDKKYIQEHFDRADKIWEQI